MTFAYLPPRLTEYQERATALKETWLSYAASYVIREAWSRKGCRLPNVSNRIKPELNAYSEQWLKLYEICGRLNMLPEDERENMPRAWDLLRLLLYEYRQDAFATYMRVEKDEPYSKREEVAKLRSLADDLSDDVNPIDPTTKPYKYRLMNNCIRVANFSDVFRERFWTPYIRSIRNWARMIDNSPNILAIYTSDDGKTLTQRQGRSNGRSKTSS